MNINGASGQHWLRVFFHFAVDTVAFGVSFLAGMRVRFADEWLLAFASYWPGVVVGALVFACAAYILGLYSLEGSNHSLFERALFLALSFAIAALVIVGFNYLQYSARFGRGVMFISGSIAYATAVLHHSVLLHLLQQYRERVALVVASPSDEEEVRLLRAFCSRYLDFAGIIHYDSYQPGGQVKILGRVTELATVARREELERVLCTNKTINDPAMCQQFCQLRYSGVTVMPLISLFEEICHCVPVELITPEWLLSASGSPHMLYLKKLKRGFDIVVSLFGLLFFWPFLLLGMGIVKLTSKGPVFYRQVRCGRFGRPFEVVKLRTMRINAEDSDPMWAMRKDPRIIPGGNFLRNYRIDEIPQLLNVLRGEMSFVGPRPERPKFVAELARQIPYYRERLLVQPGITGWAQVNYPYGASVADAKLKLEYDLYYVKNMSLFLDIFILLDTIRIILVGGLRKSHLKGLVRHQTDTDWIPASPPADVVRQPALGLAEH
jgi:exopolysaccharide biosynthesis polyprenyl glycosylphosphotransferase